MNGRNMTPGRGAGTGGYVVSLIPKDLTPVLQASVHRGTGPRRWQHPAWVDHLPPCNEACPAGENIQGWLERARDGRYREAWELLVSENPLPATHGRACYRPCESACNRASLDQSVSIHAVERFLGDLASENGWAIQPGPDTAKRVLVVGAGPAGLSCAWHLRRMGHAVEIRDANELPGGMLHYGIPAYRLPREDLLNEIRRIESMGIRFTLNTRVDDVEAAMADGGFDACFLGIGTHVGHHLDIPAADGRHMVDAVSMLRQVEKGEPPNLGRVVGIIGGGNTAFDAARVARRLGAEDATIIYRRDREHMRAEPEEADEAFLEGVKARWLSMPKQFGRDGVTVERIELGDDGSLNPTGETETLPIDSLVLALGQHAEVDFLRTVPGIDVTGGDNLVVDQQMMTGRPGIFAGGDAIGGPRTMTAATGHGKKAARCIDAWLRGETYVRGTKHPGVAFEDLNLPVYLSAPRASQPELPPEARAGFAEVVAGLKEHEARAESDRCLACGNCFECDNCYAVCPEQAILRLGRGRGYEVDLDACTGCGSCYEQCPCHAIVMRPESGDDGRRGDVTPSTFRTRA